MIKIPSQLHKDEMKIILLNKSDKVPLEQEWQVKNNYLYDDEKVIKHIKAGGNYGVVCDGSLIVIDADTNELNEIIKKKFPKTFTVQTSKGFHYYFDALGFDKKKVLKKDGLHLGEIQSNGTFVVGANCVHPSGGVYKITKNIPITKIDPEKINYLLGEYFTSERINKEVIVKGSSSGLRNDSMFRLACSFREKELSTGECFTALKGINTKNTPPLSDRELNTIVSSAYKYEKKSSNIGVAAKTFTQDYVDFSEDFFKTQPFYYDEVGCWWVWRERESFWDMIDETALLNEIYESCKQSGIKIISSSIKNEIITSMKMVGRRHKPKDAPEKWIQFKDKVFSLKSGKIHGVTHHYFFTNPIPWEIGEDSKTPTIDKLFKEWVGEKYVETLYEILAYCCYSNYPIQVLFCLYGGGRNGKTCFLKVLNKFIGTTNLCSTDLDLIVGNNKSRFEIFKLYRKLACLMGETNFGLMESSAILKKLVGGDLIGFEMKGKQPFDAYNYAKIIIASNSLPSSSDTSEGFYRRWVIIDFPNQFKEGKDITLTIPEEEYNALAKKCCEILPKLLEKGEFTNQGSIEDRKHKYIMASNPLPHFIKSYCYQRPDGYIRYSELFAVYCKYLAYIKRRVISKKEFTTNLNKEGFENRRTSKEGELDQYVEGIEWKDEFKDYGVNGVYTKIHTSLTHRKSNEEKGVNPVNSVIENEKKEEKIFTEQESVEKIDKLKNI